MKERQFAGVLNSKSVYGQSYGDSQCFRYWKLNKIYSLNRNYNVLTRKWFRWPNTTYPSWGKSLWNLSGDITWTQRQENKGRKKKKFEMFRWKR